VRGGLARYPALSAARGSARAAGPPCSDSDPARVRLARAPGCARQSSDQEVVTTSTGLPVASRPHQPSCPRARQHHRPLSPWQHVRLALPFHDRSPASRATESTSLQGLRIDRHGLAASCASEHVHAKAVLPPRDAMSPSPRVACRLEWLGPSALGVRPRRHPSSSGA